MFRKNDNWNLWNDILALLCSNVMWTDWKNTVASHGTDEGPVVESINCKIALGQPHWD